MSRNESENDISHTSELSLGDISIPNNSQNNLKRKSLPTLQSLKNKPIIVNTINGGNIGNKPNDCQNNQ